MGAAVSSESSSSNADVTSISDYLTLPSSVDEAVCRLKDGEDGVQSNFKFRDAAEIERLADALAPSTELARVYLERM